MAQLAAIDKKIIKDYADWHKLRSDFVIFSICVIFDKNPFGSGLSTIQSRIK
jgi:hypothetical protein